MPRNRLVLLISVLFFLFMGLGKAGAQRQDYQLAKDAAKSGDKEFALMHFSSVLKNDPDPNHRQEALFAVAEYYYLAGDFPDSLGSLSEFLENYPDSKLRPVALFLLLEISENFNNDSLSKSVEKQIMDLKRIFLVFKEAQEYSFKSPLGLDYKLIYYIDKIEFFINGQLKKQIIY
ncbi:MAG: outer membrane protein assembly factor BamD [Candidatus Omnitrophota bacterium]